MLRAAANDINLYICRAPVPIPPRMGDICEIREIRIPCRVGVDAWEADTLQTLSVDLSLPVDVAAAARSDDLSKTVDYRAVADGLFKAHEGRRVQLVETVAESVATWVLSHTAAAWVDVRVSKEITQTAAKTATICIHRGRT